MEAIALSLDKQEGVYCMQFLTYNTVRINLEKVTSYIYNPEEQELTIYFGRNEQCFEGEFAKDLSEALDREFILNTALETVPSQILTDLSHCLAVHLVALEIAAKRLSDGTASGKSNAITTLVHCGFVTLKETSSEALGEMLDKTLSAWREATNGAKS
jgi:hypothetical protein